MNHRNTRDLAWWHICQWAPAHLRIITMALIATLGFGCAIGPIFVLFFGLTTGIVVGLTAGLANGVAVGLFVGLREDHWNAPEHRPLKRGWRTVISQPNRAAGIVSGIAAGIVSGIAAGIAFGLERGLTDGVVIGLAAAFTFGLACGTVEALLEARRSAGPRRLMQLRWRTVISKGNLAVGLTFGLVFGLVFGLTLGVTDGPIIGLAGGAAVGLVTWLVFSIINGLVQTSVDSSRAIDPIGC